MLRVMLACLPTFTHLSLPCLLQSPLSLLQRVQLLIGSYPFMPDDSLLEHLVAVAAPHNTTTNNGTNAAN